MSLTVGVLGAGGTIAPAIVRDLAESEEVESLWLLDLDGRQAAVVAAAHGGGKARAAGVDARRRDDLAAALEPCDVLVNSASYRINLDAMEGCLRAGCDYVDLGGLYWMTGRQLELSERFERSGRLAILGMGSSPGKTNVMAVRAIRELGAPVEALHVAAAGRDYGPPPADGALSVPYALQTLVDEVTMRPVAVLRGEPAELAPLSPGAPVDFGDPIGEAETIHTLHSEMRTFPESFGCREASFRLALPPLLLERLRTLAGAAQEDVDEAARATVPPSPETVSAHRVDALADGRVATVRAVTRPMPGWGLGGGVVSTAAPAAAAVRLLARRTIERTGVLPPERCVDPDDLLPELERRSCEFAIDIRDAAEAA